jgi:hypothetical protein
VLGEEARCAALGASCLLPFLEAELSRASFADMCTRCAVARQPLLLACMLRPHAWCKCECCLTGTACEVGVAKMGVQLHFYAGAAYMVLQCC